MFALQINRKLGPESPGIRTFSPGHYPLDKYLRTYTPRIIAPRTFLTQDVYNPAPPPVHPPPPFLYFLFLWPQTGPDTNSSFPL